MTDQPNPNPNSNMSVAITNYFKDGRLDLILSLFETLKSQRDRAERNVDAYKHEIHVLATRFADITEPHTGKKLVESSKPRTGGAAAGPTPNAKPKPPAPPKSSSGVDVGGLTF